MKKTKKIFIYTVLMVLFITLVGSLFYYFGFYRKNRKEVVNLSKEYVTFFKECVVISDELANDDITPDEVEKQKQEIYEKMCNYYIDENDDFKNNYEILTDFVDSQVSGQDDLLCGREVVIDDVVDVKVTSEAAVVVLDITSKSIYGVGDNSYKSRYTISLVMSDKGWKIESFEYEPLLM